MAKKFVGQEYAVATRGKGLKQDSWWVRFLSRTTITFSIIVMAISITMIAFCSIFTMAPVIGTSMMTQLNATGKDTDSALTCHLMSAERGDIVIYKLYAKDTGDTHSSNDYLKQRYPNTDNNGRYMYIIKRLIAKGGDIIKVTRERNSNTYSLDMDDFNYDYSIYLNGEKLNEYYLDPLVAHPSSKNFVQLWRALNNPSRAMLESWQATSRENCVFTDTDGSYGPSNNNSTNYLKVPEGYHFLMGDNRNGFDDGNPSWDSCYLGPQSQQNYSGKCVDIVHEDTSMPEYLWNKIVYYVFFGWLWQN